MVKGGSGSPGLGLGRGRSRWICSSQRRNPPYGAHPPAAAPRPSAAAARRRRRRSHWPHSRSWPQDHQHTQERGEGKAEEKQGKKQDARGDDDKTHTCLVASAAVDGFLLPCFR